MLYAPRLCFPKDLHLGGGRSQQEKHEQSRGAGNISVAPLQEPDGSGAAFGGHALFVKYRDDKPVIAHEMRHAQQMEKRGNRFRYMVSYLDENGGSVMPGTSEYEQNPYENDARYVEYLYEYGYVDIYGKKKGNWTHEEVAQGFRDWMWKVKGYMSFRYGGENGDWVWSPCWECGNDF